MSASTLLIYGIAMKSPLYMVPWILISALSYVSVMVALFIIHSQLLPGVFVSFGAFGKIKSFLVWISCNLYVFSRQLDRINSVHIVLVHDSSVLQRLSEQHPKTPCFHVPHNHQGLEWLCSHVESIKGNREKTDRIK